MLTEINEENFEQIVLKAVKPIMVKYGFEECRPCKNIVSLIEQLQSEYECEIEVYEIDTDSCTNLVKQYQIKAAPTILFFKDGVEMDRYTGYDDKTKKELKDRIDKLIQVI